MSCCAPAMSMARRNGSAPAMEGGGSTNDSNMKSCQRREEYEQSIPEMGMAKQHNHSGATNVSVPEEVSKHLGVKCQVVSKYLLGEVDPKEGRPTVMLETINSSRAIVGRWADAKDDNGFEEEDALQTTAGAFIEMGKRHRGRPPGGGNSQGLLLVIFSL
ncbi:hypothetical protein NE237_013478 [Protea cynaroides]|uniref:Uncharacterized protein n=1 Tax=Protea cynaroides TaxID=273540 RepID=A0A9Q0H264_9MAGN|nr:hypothetical protein NE237_013478 [Protea cynaroides]